MKEFFTKLAKFLSLLVFLAIAGICTLMLLGPVIAAPSSQSV